MAYLKEFLKRIDQRDFQKFSSLWQEYCQSDSIDLLELTQLLEAIKNSDFAKPFGTLVEAGIPLLGMINEESSYYNTLRLLIDLQTTNSAVLADFAFNALQKKYGQHPKFNDYLRIVGLRNRDQFQSALSKFDLITHLSKGNAVFHTGGWGTGEIIDVSFVREHIIVEFENVTGKKDISFINAFKTLIPLSFNHFLARRFLNPDLLEAEGKKDPVAIIKILLRDLGPKSASEIKDELCSLVIPETEWVKWWQLARAKLKKDHLIHVPESLKEPFLIRQKEVTQESRLLESLKESKDPKAVIQEIYAFVRDNINEFKNEALKKQLFEVLLGILENQDLNNAQAFQALILLQEFFAHQPARHAISERIKSDANIASLIDQIEIIAFKKCALVAIKENRSDWSEIFLSLIFLLPQSQLRDYILKELNRKEVKAQLNDKITYLLNHPTKHPEAFFWYFQKLLTKDDDSLLYNNDQGRGLFLDGFLVLLNKIENQPEYRDLIKKMYSLLTNDRYAVIRQILKDKSLEFTKEFLLLASKCQAFNELDQKSFKSLAAVIHPSLASPKEKKGSAQSSIIWTTEQGYLRTQDRVRQIGTLEMVENAREIEAARALGDLRENSEFKYAQEKRARLQNELKTLAHDLQHARVITPDDVHLDEIGIGSKVKIEDGESGVITYSILGPWDADPDKHILSFNSKFALAMMGKKRGETFSFKETEYTVLSIDTLFPQ
jgi:transcription elongation factor GreA-like protein/transcription elongation GreA/GreB family factor